MNIKVDPEFESLIPALNAEEYALLEANIVREGCRDLLRVWKVGGADVLLDGHNRYRICKKHTIQFGTTPIKLESREAALLWIEQNQLGRRNLTDDQRSIIAGRVANRKAELSRKEQLAGARKLKLAEARKLKGNKKDTVVNDVLTTEHTIPAKLRVDQEVAKESRVPLRKVRAAQKLDKAAPELAKKVLDGELTLNQAARKIEKPKSGEKVSDKKFNRCVSHAFGILSGIQAALDAVGISGRPISCSASEREGWLETAIAIKTQIEALILELSRDPLAVDLLTTTTEGQSTGRIN